MTQGMSALEKWAKSLYHMSWRVGYGYPYLGRQNSGKFKLKQE